MGGILLKINYNYHNVLHFKKLGCPFVSCLLHVSLMTLSISMLLRIIDRYNVANDTICISASNHYASTALVTLFILVRWITSLLVRAVMHGLKKMKS